MKTFNDIWEKAILNLEEEQSVYVMKTWINALKPVFRDENNYYFSVEVDLQKKTIEDRFLASITEAMEEAYEESTGTINSHIHPIILLEQQAEELRKKKKPPKEKIQKHDSVIPLDPDLTFDTFVVGECNRFANTVAKRVAENPGNKFSNPLFLYGGPSLGKSHLLHAIGNYIYSHNENAKIVYVTSEIFLNEFISMIRMNGDTRTEFQKRYREIDVLLIDDIQFFSGKEGIQDEFFHTFEALHNVGKQIVITSDKPPKDLEQVEERLLSRFEWGMTADIKAPDYETRVAILMEKARAFSKIDENMPEIEQEVFHYIASLVTTDIRQLESALRKVIVYSEFNNSLNSDIINIDIAQKALSEYLETGTSKIINPEYIINFISMKYNVTVEDIKGKKRNREIAVPRMISQYLIRKICNNTYQNIANIFNSHYSSIMHAEENIKEKMKNDKEFKNIIEDIEVRIKE